MEQYRGVVRRVAVIELLLLVAAVGFFVPIMIPPLAWLNALVGAVLAWFGVRPPVTSWRQSFWTCFDATYAAAIVATIIAYRGISSALLGFCLIPALVFGTAAAIATTFKEGKA
jgi:hypothetical protein